MTLAPSRVRDRRAIDCDVHIVPPALATLEPYLDDYWVQYHRDVGHPALESNSYPDNAPLSARPEWRPAGGAAPASDFATLHDALLEPWGLRHAILNCHYGAHHLPNPYWEAAACRALNDWQTAEWLDRDPRLLGSIMVPLRSVEAGVAELERLGGDPRFVQALLPGRTEHGLGRREHWPLYEACVRLGLPVAVYPGGDGGYPLTGVGWPSLYVEEYVSVAQQLQAQLLSFIAEGVFIEFPALRVVLMESGVSWLPALMWRFEKDWKGLRRELPWLERPGLDTVREHFRFTAQPFDRPQDPEQVARLLEQIGGDDMLLFATDFPHWHFDDPEDVLPRGLSPELEEKIMVANPSATYRLPA